MQHPILKTLLARLRAFEAIERASFALATIDALMEPFERHRIRVALEGEPSISAMGDEVGAMFGHLPEGAPATTLFRQTDSGFVARLITSLVQEELGCHFAATAANAASIPVMLEGLILPEPPVAPGAPLSHLSLCLIRSDFPGEIVAIGPLSPMSLGPSRFITLENRGADRAALYRLRWPRPGIWTDRV